MSVTSSFTPSSASKPTVLAEFQVVLSESEWQEIIQERQKRKETKEQESDQNIIEVKDSQVPQRKQDRKLKRSNFFEQQNHD